jgi:hypothetical protein
VKLDEEIEVSERVIGSIIKVLPDEINHVVREGVTMMNGP